eukprot:CAMPEP_0117023438 /NCGR_PEP_ID=MMETSP0472-20121206/17495_1 /TAXON_ID=693140 ORGANISM="Tiarina fusus, Strain LIS" /NCGR_SAMPLE_ID=MMETSP0472 /ASSEMBLY_ACC=CAM_ASM_000603 /LENGTH=256 /DNA_ID=CAMNT_0004729561 /DNA_START=28 /DNA_END=798 /DNA_ORIENTATION=-
MSSILKCAQALAAATPKARVAAWPAGCAPSTIQEAYEIQKEVGNILHKRQVGWKVVDNDWLHERFETDQLAYGRLYSDKVQESATTSIKLSDYFHPRIEPHYTFKISSDVTESVDYYTIQSKIAGMRTTVDVTDARLEINDELKNSFVNFIADNCRSEHVLIGEVANWIQTDLGTSESVIYVDKKHIQTAVHTDHINPLASLHRFLNQAVKEGLQVKRGQWVSIALNFPVQQQVREGQEVVAYTRDMTENIVRVKE